MTQREVFDETREAIINECIRAGLQYSEGLITFGEAQARIQKQLQRAVDDAVEVED